MGIDGLSYLIRDATPDAVMTNQTLKHYSGKIIAMDAYQYLYQSMSVKTTKNRSKEENKKENETSPLLKTFYSCIRLLENGIKPLYVFDGAPPKLKEPVIKERAEKREAATAELKVAKEKGDINQVNYLKNKTVKVGKPEIKNCTGLLKLLGIPFFYAPGEAEAQCAAFVESGLVYASATQDMDALIYGTKVVLRHLPIHNKSRYPLEEIHLDKVLHRLQLSLPELIDLSIMLGCDYCKGINGLGAHRALELLHKYRSIENIIDKLDRNTFFVPNNWLFKEARMQFLNPKVKDCDIVKELRWNEPDYEGILKYLEGEVHFDKSTVWKHLRKIPKGNITT